MKIKQIMNLLNRKLLIIITIKMPLKFIPYNSKNRVIYSKKVL